MRVLWILVLLMGCGTGAANLPNFIAFEDGSQGYSFRSNSSILEMGSDVPQEKVINDYVTYHNLCSGGYEIVSMRELSPEDTRYTEVDAVIRCL